MFDIITKFAGDNTGWLLAIAAGAGLLAWITRTMRLKGEVARRERNRLERRTEQEQQNRDQLDADAQQIQDRRSHRRDNPPDDEPLTERQRRDGLDS